MIFLWTECILFLWRSVSYSYEQTVSYSYEQAVSGTWLVWKDLFEGFVWWKKFDDWIFLRLKQFFDLKNVFRTILNRDCFDWSSYCQYFFHEIPDQNNSMHLLSLYDESSSLSFLHHFQSTLRDRSNFSGQQEYLECNNFTISIILSIAYNNFTIIITR